MGRSQPGTSGSDPAGPHRHKLQRDLRPLHPLGRAAGDPKPHNDPGYPTRGGRGYRPNLGPVPNDSRWAAARPTYSLAPRAMSAACSSLTSLTRLAGMPTMRLWGGNSRPSGTTAPAATIEPSPIFAPLRMVHPIPTRQLSSISHPCTTALWPRTHPSPTTAGKPGSAWRMQPSCTLVLAPIRMGSVSPRNTAPYQTLDSSPRCTSPMTHAPGATQADRATCGKVLPCGNTLPLSFRSNAAPLPCAQCTRSQISMAPFGCHYAYAGALRVLRRFANRPYNVAHTSTSTASPWPPPEQMAARPFPPPLRRSS